MPSLALYIGIPEARGTMMDGFAAQFSRQAPIPGAHFGDTVAPARSLDPGMGVAVARRTVFRPEDADCFGRVADRVAAGNVALLGHDLTDADRREQARLRNAI